MSQITRCPSCATSFKVVADQLRISEGWVRCGQCKEVFDASAHLLPETPPSLLPDVSLTDVRPPSMPVARKVDAVRVWGGGASAPVAPVRVEGVAEVGGTDPLLSEPGSRYKEALPPLAPAMPAPVLDVPRPAVPAFLAAGGNEGGASDDGWSLAPATPFAWRSPAPPMPGRLGDSEHLLPPSASDFVPAMPSMAVVVPSVAEATGPAAIEPLSESWADKVPEKLGGGYELPFADLGDSDGPADGVVSNGTRAAAGSESAYSALTLPVVPPLPALPEGIEHDESLSSAPLAELPSESLPSVDFVQPSLAEAPAVLALVKDDSLAAVLQASARKTSREAGGADAPEEELHDAGQEVSFVVAARRRAFWRKPLVRVALVWVVLLCLLGLALQVAVQERDRLVALDARARPWLLRLCEQLRCEIAPQRQIADVVIDSSSFNKTRGDSYQLALTMKSKADLPLAMPAVELTLTDSQDQPVLRRVLLPADMAAPAELSARGEWSTSVSVIVTTGGARVAGYRLLAFYP